MSRSFIIRTKLRPPRLPDGLVPRPELQSLLDPRRHRVVLVAAPTGYGKSTALASWVEAWEGRTAWVSLDRGDDDPATFLAHLVLRTRAG